MVNLSRAWRWAMAVAAGFVALVLVLVLVMTVGSLGTADAVGSVIAAITGLIVGGVTLLTLRVPPPPAMSDVLNLYAEELRRYVNAELHRRGLDERTLLPLQLIRLSFEPIVRRQPYAAQRGNARHNGETIWPLIALQDRLTKAINGVSSSRIFLYGEPGAGKSTVAIMLAAGLLRRRKPNEAVLLLSLDTWDGMQGVEDWLDRRLAQSYPSLRVLAGARTSLANRLIYGASLTLVLDGLDLVPTQLRAEIVTRVNQYIPRQHRVLFLSRHTVDRPHQALTVRPAVLRLAKCSAKAVAALYADRALQAGTTDWWKPVVDRLRADPDGRLAEVLRTPWHAVLAWQVYSTANSVPGALLTLAERPEKEIVATLHERFLQTKTQLDDLKAFPAAMRSLAYVAHQMQRFGVWNLAWWRLFEALPTWVLMVFIGLSVAPAYQLALHLPPGLTRGFTIGSTAGVTLGMLRGIRTTKLDGLITGGCAIPVVALIGLTEIGLKPTVLDVIQVPLAVGLVVAAKDRLVRGWPALLLVPAIGLVTATAVQTLILAGIWTGRTASGVLLSTTLGVGVAVLAVRILADPAVPPQPSRVAFGGNRRWRRLPADLIAGVTASVPVGLAGGAAGAAQQHNIRYGIALALVFGLVAGVPIGLVGGMIRWVRTGTSGPAAISPLSSLRNDRTVALAAIGTVGLAATVSIVAFSEALRSLSPVIASGLTIEWYHGLMFGSSLGLVVASIYTAWPTFFVYHFTLWVSRRLPWRFGSYFEALHRHGVLRQEGALYQFHQESMQDFLDESWHRSPDDPVSCPRPRALPVADGRRHRWAPNS